MRDGAGEVGNHLLRIVVLFTGLCLMSFGISLSVRAGLGTTPISTPPLVTAAITGLTFGTTTVLFNSVLLLLQIAIRRRKFHPIQLLQLPAVVVFGVLIDTAMRLTEPVDPSSYLEQWMWCALGIVGVGSGVALQVTARSIMLPGEGFALAISQELFDQRGAKPKYAFGNVKIVVDSSLVLLSAVVSALVLRELVGVREGTVAAALLVGWFAKHVIAALRPAARRILGDD